MTTVDIIPVFNFELILCLSRYYCIYSSHVITPLINSSLYSCVTCRQVKGMVTLNLFIESHYKYIVSIIRVKHILTLHLSTANCRVLTTTGCCCKNVAATQCSCYGIYFCLVESIPQFLECWPMPMHFRVGSSFTLLYRNAPSYGIILPCLKLKNFNLPNHVYYCIVLTLTFKCHWSKPL